jgi:UDP:flavonoid glycosyltransferase YjiC (YdhE family)
LPIKDDQPVVAQQVADAGAGIRLKFGRVRAPELRDAIARVLDEPSYRDAARRISTSFAQAGGAEGAADLLTAMARHRGAASAKPTDEESGHGESHSLQRGGAASSERAVQS